MHILATFDYSPAARLGFSTHYQPARGAPGRIRSTIMLEGYLLKYASSSKRISSGAKSRMLVFTTSKGLKYGPLNASRVKKLAWGDIARCQQVANNDVCFVVVTNREKEIKFECDNQVQRDAWCKYINENKTGALAVPTVKNNITTNPWNKNCTKKALRRRTTVGCFLMKNPLSLFSVMLENRVIFQIVGNTLLAFFR